MERPATLVQTKSVDCKSYIVFILGFYTLVLTSTLSAQTYDGLIHLDGYKTKVHYSIGTDERAKLIAGRCDKVLAYYKSQIKFEPSVTVLILSPEDWPRYTKFPVYGMPHYNDNKTLIVASQNNDFWKSFIPPVDQLPKELKEQIINTYSDNGNLTMESFFDLLAIHELGHAFHIQGGLIMQRKWMAELFANILLHTYIAENEPELLSALTVFPKMVISRGKSGLRFTSLTDMENQYNEIGRKYPQNYGWYQSRWHAAAANIYNSGGVELFKKLWATLKIQKEILGDDEFAVLLSKNVHQSVADVQLKWDE